MRPAARTARPFAYETLLTASGVPQAPSRSSTRRPLRSASSRRSARCSRLRGSCCWRSRGSRTTRRPRPVRFTTSTNLLAMRDEHTWNEHAQVARGPDLRGDCTSAEAPPTVFTSCASPSFRTSGNIYLLSWDMIVRVLRSQLLSREDEPAQHAVSTHCGFNVFDTHGFCRSSDSHVNSPRHVPSQTW